MPRTKGIEKQSGALPVGEKDQKEKGGESCATTF